jgi:hypothetical protein
MVIGEFASNFAKQINVAHRSAFGSDLEVLMYCPQCGQQQIAESSRFCSRCGLLVSGLAEWLAHGGVVPAMPPQEPTRRPMTPKRKGIRRGALFMFISGVLLPIFFALSVLNDSPGPLIVPITVFFAGLSVMLYSLIFGEEFLPPPSQPPEPTRLAGMFRSNALPPPSHNPAQSVMDHRVRTSELAQPPSVTENTTRLLDQDENR